MTSLAQAWIAEMAGCVFPSLVFNPLQSHLSHHLNTDLPVRPLCLKPFTSISSPAIKNVQILGGSLVA